MGDACRTKGEHSKQFALAVATVRQAMLSPTPVSGPAPAIGPGGGRVGSGFAPPLPTPGFNAPVEFRSGAVRSAQNGLGGGGPQTVFVNVSNAQARVNPPAPETFWEQYQTLCSQQDKTQSRPEQRETIILARIAALSQILMPMSEMHPGFVKYLSTVSHVEATRALARMAIFCRGEDARKAAIDALKVRRERDYTEILVNGLRYPWPAVAHAPPRPSPSWNATICCRSSSTCWNNPIRALR